MTLKSGPPRTRVVILGALSAVAIELARIYSKENAALLLVARNRERLETLATDLRLRGAVQVDAVHLDLATAASDARRYIREWSEKLGGITHVHVIYGYLGSQEKASADDAELSRILQVNFNSAAQWSEAAAGFLKAQKSGSLVVVSSVAGDRGRQSNYAYGAAKGAIALYVQGLAHSMVGSGARAVVVKPGFIDTPMTDGLKKGGPLWASARKIARILRKAANKGGPISYAPGVWRFIMLAIRSTPAFVFHKTKL